MKPAWLHGNPSIQSSVHIPMPNLDKRVPPLPSQRITYKYEIFLPNLEQHLVHYFRQAISITAQDT